jgi:hypothetical protein
MKATKDGYSGWMAGQWGLVQCNDPTFVWDATPQLDLVGRKEKELLAQGMTEEQIGKWSESAEAKGLYEKSLDEYGPMVDAFAEALICHPCIGYELVLACKQAGFNGKYNAMQLAYWLFDYLAEWISQHEPKHHGRDGQDPKWDAVRPKVE